MSPHGGNGGGGGLVGLAQARAATERVCVSLSSPRWLARVRLKTQEKRKESAIWSCAQIWKMTKSGSAERTKKRSWKRQPTTQKRVSVQCEMSESKSLQRGRRRPRRVEPWQQVLLRQRARVRVHTRSPLVEDVARRVQPHHARERAQLELLLVDDRVREDRDEQRGGQRHEREDQKREQLAHRDDHLEAVPLILLRQPLEAERRLVALARRLLEHRVREHVRDDGGHVVLELVVNPAVARVARAAVHDALVDIAGAGGVVVLVAPVRHERHVVEVLIRLQEEGGEGELELAARRVGRGHVERPRREELLREVAQLGLLRPQVEAVASRRAVLGVASRLEETLRAQHVLVEVCLARPWSAGIRRDDKRLRVNARDLVRACPQPVTVRARLRVARAGPHRTAAHVAARCQLDCTLLDAVRRLPFVERGVVRAAHGLPWRKVASKLADTRVVP
eukprot:335400-Prymnesium_polylepis.2